MKPNKKKSQLIALLLCLFMLCSVLSACGNSEDPGSNGGSQSDDNTLTSDSQNANEQNDDEPEDIAELELLMWTLAGMPTDLDMVQEAINKITREKISAEVNLNIVEMGNYIQQANLMMTSGEKLDLVITQPGGATHFNAMASQKQLQPLDDLLAEYAPETLALMSDELLSGTRVDGQLYALTSYGDKVNDLYFICRADILEEIEVSASDINSVDDLAEVFAKVKEAHPEMIPLTGGNYNMMTYPGHSVLGNFSDSEQFDSLGDTSMVLAVAFLDNPFEVVNYYESDQWKNNIKIVADWYNKGYVDKDAALRSETAESIIQTGNAFGFFKELAFGAEITLENLVGYDLEFIKVSDGIVGTSLIRKFTWGIPTASTEPEAAAKFLNLMYTDEEVLNLISWGIEGVHYQKLDDGTIDFMDNQNADNSGYYIGDVSSLVGNGFLAHVWNGNDPDMRQQAQALNEAAVVSPLSGFGLDSSDLENTYTALTAVLDEYRNALRCGFYTEALQAEFEAKLKDAGADKYVAAIQEQLDAWLASQ